MDIQKEIDKRIEELKEYSLEISAQLHCGAVKDYIHLFVEKLQSKLEDEIMLLIRLRNKLQPSPRVIEEPKFRMDEFQDYLFQSILAMKKGETAFAQTHLDLAYNEINVFLNMKRNYDEVTRNLKWNSPIMNKKIKLVQS